MTIQPHVRVELLSHPLYLCGARDLVTSVARRLGFGEASAGRIALAVDEALCNVIRHGYDRRTDQPITIELSPLGPPEAAEGLRVVIEDRGRQVEPEQIRGRDLRDLRPGGLGVHIIREVMDRVVYEKREGAGMRLTMEKRRTAGDESRAEDGLGGGSSTGSAA